MVKTLDDGLKKIKNENYIKLAYKILIRKMKSYIEALELYKEEKTNRNLNRVEEIEKELMSPFYLELAELTIGIVDFEYIIKKLREKKTILIKKFIRILKI